MLVVVLVIVVLLMMLIHVLFVALLVVCFVAVRMTRFHHAYSPITTRRNDNYYRRIHDADTEIVRL